eukprot:scaffold3801_cov75-Attheya_sp.AAC.4
MSSLKRIMRTPPPRKKASERTPFAPLPSNACCTPQPKQHTVGYIYRYGILPYTLSRVAAACALRLM